METLLEVQELSLHFPIYGGIFKKKIGAVQALNKVSLTVKKGETIGIVGESGCGKTTLGRTIVRLYEPTHGRILFQGKDISHIHQRDLKKARQNIQMVFQDPYGSLNPRMSIGDTLEEPLICHKKGNQKERQKRVEELLNLVGLSQDVKDRFPHEFSGGQRQRISIARALALNPQLIIADEPVSALDVSIQSQILNLLVDLQKQYQLSYVFISHDLTVVRHIADYIAVMYLGEIIEMAPTDDLFQNPRHPYTKALLNSIPSQGKEMIPLEGDLPSPSNPPTGCYFHPRCPFVMTQCKTQKPIFKDQVACHL